MEAANEDKVAEAKALIADVQTYADPRALAHILQLGLLAYGAVGIYDRCYSAASTSGKVSASDVYEALKHIHELFGTMKPPGSHRLEGIITQVLASDIAQLARGPAEVYELRDIHPLFRAAAPKLWPSRRWGRPDNSNEKRCDALLLEGGKLIPVEIKRGDFNRRARIQLQSYIEVYEAAQGIAVGRALTTDLPSNIEFVSIDQLKKAV